MYHNDIIQISNILGILGESAHTYFENKKNRAVHDASIDPDTVEQLIKDRNTARAEKDWAKADQIRDQLSEMNIVIEDRKDGTIWKVKDSTIS